MAAQDAEGEPGLQEDAGVEREPVLGLLREVWESLADLCRPFSERQWELATDCPGWSVKDNVSHMVGTERILLGETPPPAPDPMPPHVHNPIGEVNEAWVTARRGTPGADVLDEFVDVTGRRLAILGGLAESSWAQIGWSPIGQVPYRDFMAIRVFDCYTHELDIRRAVGIAGHLDGPLADFAVGRVVQALPFVLGKKVAPADGTIVRWEVTRGGTAPPRVATVEVLDGRGAMVDDTSGMRGPAVRLRMDTETFLKLGCGRGDPRQEPVEVEGDRDLAGAIVQSMAFMI